MHHSANWRACLLLLFCLFPAASLHALSILTYNVGGNGATNWSTNSVQVQAIGRQMQYLQPDVITFNEVPFSHSSQMTNFVPAYLPGYFLAMNSGTDGAIRSAIISRYPIVRSVKWLDGVSLVPFGYTNTNPTFTRDLFEAEINVPGFSNHLHVFTTHLKALADSQSAARRAAEASAISNFFVTTFLPINGQRPYLLTGDLNEDVSRPPSSSQHPIERLVNAATGLRLTTPRNPVTSDERTWSIRNSSLTVRFDYVLPGGLLFSNMASSQVFRSDRLSPMPPNLFTNDSRTASDHLPVLVVFHNPYDTRFGFTAIALSNQLVRLNWQTTTGRQYRVEGSPDFISWSSLSTNLTATSSNLSWTLSRSGNQQFLRVYRLP